MIIVGIDPGKSGGIVVLFEGGDTAVYKMPPTERDIWDVFERISKYCKNNNKEVTAYLEKVHSMPSEGVSSVWTFSGGYHGLRMALIGNRIPFYDVTPLTWQKSLSVAKKSKSVSKIEHKNNLKARAQELFPKLEVTLATADALLIAQYGKSLNIF